MIGPWWERWPERLEDELQALRDAGIPFERDEDAFKAGVLHLTVQTTVDGEALTLDVVFPDFYPKFRFEVSAPQLDLAHHQHPLSKNLCLLGRRTSNWHTTYRLADFLQTQVPRAIRAGRSTDRADVAGIEEQQAEPFSDYYPYAHNVMLLVDSSWVIDPTIQGGQLLVGFKQRDALDRGAVLEVRDPRGNIIVSADPILARVYPHKLLGRWVRSPQPVHALTPDAYAATLPHLDPTLEALKLEWRHINKNELGIDITGVIFPEEVRWRESSDGWVFVVRHRPRGRSAGEPKAFLARAGRAGRHDLVARVPELAPLTEHRIALFGAGGIGAPSAIGFARTQIGELRILDGDFVEPGTVVRWSLGLSIAGMSKVDSLATFLDHNYPYVHVVTKQHHIGAVRDVRHLDHPEMVSDSQVMDDMLDGTSLVYDATAELGVHDLLSSLAAELRIPYIYAHSTHGAWGGLVARIVPGRTQGCWLCLQYALDDGTIPPPPADPQGEVQPAGCASPTFTGTGFDVEYVANEGVRLAIGTLTSSVAGGYPDADWDVATLALRDKTGRRVPPRWTSYRLAQHPNCSLCAQET